MLQTRTNCSCNYVRFYRALLAPFIQGNVSKRIMDDSSSDEDEASSDDKQIGSRSTPSPCGSPSTGSHKKDLPDLGMLF